LFRSDHSEFTALLYDTTRDAAGVLANRIQDAIKRIVCTTTGDVTAVDVPVRVVSAPEDGESLRDLLVAARIRTPRPTQIDSSIVH
jgi:hypothetical protein